MLKYIVNTFLVTMLVAGVSLHYHEVAKLSKKKHYCRIWMDWYVFVFSYPK